MNEKRSSSQLFSSRKLVLVIAPLLFLSLAPIRPALPGTTKATIKKIFDTALTESQCYEWLRHLCKEIGPRLSGSENAEKAVEYTYQEMKKLGLDKVEKQEVMVPHWVRGEKESGKIKSKKMGNREVPICALGSSVGTEKKGITAQVIEVQGLDEVSAMKPEEIKGKIVFFNRPMEPTHLNTFHAYGGCVDQRSGGATAASKMGALAVIVRSMGLRLDDYPHTGNMRYGEGAEPIPAAAISTNGAELLSEWLKEDPDLEFSLRLSCETLPDVKSHNVVGEIRGSEFPDEIILIGGHLDSWDLGEGAQDDGAGCVQSMEVLNIIKKLGIKPKRTIRAVMFMNEENGMRGGIKYAELAKERGEKHLAAIESDRGGFTPRGFTIESDDPVLEAIQKWSDYFKPYQLHEIKKGYGGVDISPLRYQGTTLIGFLPDSQRYFDYHHAASDVFEGVNKRELELGSAAMAALVYLISENGIPWRQSVEEPHDH